MSEKESEMTPEANEEKEEQIYSMVESLEEEILQSFMQMLRIPAFSPTNGGEGEGKKAIYLKGILESLDMDEIRVLNAQDTVSRPNIIAIRHGRDRSKRLWVMTHMDVVPPGDLSLWETDPFEPVVKEGKIFARGAEDNGQELMASIYALKALEKLGITPAMDIGLALVSDEETGSKKGIHFLLDKGIFRKDDLIIVPDAGNEDATKIEIAEKSIVWLKITTKGRQCHASTPQRGINAFSAGMRFGLMAENILKKRFDMENPIFEPPRSTFEPTKKEANVPNINTVPGEDVFYIDSRVLPEIDLDEVLQLLRKTANEVEQETGVSITIEPVQIERAAPPTPADAPVVKLLEAGIRKVWKNDPKPMGIGGGTCAAILRRAGFNTVVWGRIDEMAHAPNEYAWIGNIIGDTKVYALLYAGLV